MLLSNLGMFIVTFIIGLKTLFNKDRMMNKAEEQVAENKIENETLDQAKEEQKEDTSKSNTEESRDKYNSELQNHIMEDNNKQETIVINETKNNISNYFGIGFFSISAIFLIITIICATFFIKHQLKSKKKTSK